MRFTIVKSSLLASASLTLVSACGSGDMDDFNADEIQQSAVAGPIGTWPAITMPAKVRYIEYVSPDIASDPNVQAPNPAQLADLQSLAEQGLNETWGQVPGVSFQTVNSGEDILVMIVWATNGGAAGTSTLGSNNVILAANTSAPEETKRAIAHEVGHRLGLFHEANRPDAAAYNCPAVQLAAEWCQACLEGGCTAVELQNCTGDVLGPTGVLTAEQQQLLSNRWADVGPNPNALMLIKDWDDTSIMNYCAAEGGRLPLDYHPTPRDMLAVEMLYPARSVYPIGCGKYCYRTSRGPVVRTNGTVTSDWVARGSVDITMKLNNTSGTDIPASRLPDGASEQQYTFYSPATSTTLSNGGGPVVKSDNEHAAILNATLM